MKIVCYLCKKVIGEQKPFDNPAEVLAKCTNCLAKEKEQALQALKKEPMPEPGQPREVILENGLKGMLSVGGAETEKLSFWDMIFAGKKFFCISSVQKEFQQYLAGISAEEVDVTFLHSSVIKIDTPLKGRRRKKTPDIAEDRKSVV